ncbi:organic anion transporting polypeptide 33Ea [Arctopsyche grandis]|uniref:organic anion transporting polypeptide 33Ea n=1 Tax=Arctopsyche grandis TaxID=121162 RepID=UPI00406D9E36
MSTEVQCGVWNFRPKCLQKFATPRSFMIIYGFLGTVQAMSFIYFVVSLTTMERRFKIPSQTTGIMLSGNEISQILFSLFLSYFGGQRNRPRWIAWGVLLSALSCFILASPHFIYGPGEDALALTKEYADMYFNSTNTTSSGKSALCTSSKSFDTCDKVEFLSEYSLLPVVLVFFSQFILGIGNTLYFSLGNTYMDDNTKKTRTPMLLAYASALRTLGPAFGFVFGPLCLSLYIDPSLTPLIDKNDARWMGAWWLGWIIIGFLMLLFTFLVGMFPKHLPKVVKTTKPEIDLPQYRKITHLTPKVIDEIPLTKKPISMSVIEKTQEPVTPDEIVPEDKTFPTMKELPIALKRLLKNKILMANISSGVFYILGASAYITYMAKYIEIQYNRSAISSTLIAGPAILIGVLIGFLLSGWYISTRQPRPRKLLMWNVIVGFVYLIGELSYIFISCPQNSIEQQISLTGRSNLIVPCNNDCMCESIKYSPVCHKPTGQIYFSACHAGCKEQLSHSQVYTNCSCIASYPMINLLNSTNSKNAEGPPYNVPESDWNLLHAGSCSAGCMFGYYMFSVIAMLTNVLGSSGKIGNILVNYRCVDIKDKAFAQGLLLLMISLFALIPGPIMYGSIIDSTCIEWGEKCGQRTNCLMYNKDQFRLYINATAFCFTFIAVLLDGVVCYLGKDLDLYGDDEPKKREIKAIST